MKRYIIVILALSVIILLTLLYNFHYLSEQFEEYIDAEIVSNLNRDKNNTAGFFSRVFEVFNHYLYCKIHRINFSIDSHDWLFRSVHGWTDYFEDVRLNYYESKTRMEKNMHESLDEYTAQQYREVIPEVYRYNATTKKQIRETKQKLGLTEGEYDSIFIRRGDKLGAESILIPEQMYLDILLQKSPRCKTIYLQTDDYHCYTRLSQLVQDKGLDIRILTLCPKDSVGVVVFNDQKKVLNESAQSNEANKDYLANIIDKLNATTAVEDMNRDEIYKHVMDMIVGIDLVAHSKVCVLDYQSNVSRFIKLFHDRPENVYDVNSPEKDIVYGKKITPSYGF
jgi:hypothetical protein